MALLQSPLVLAILLFVSSLDLGTGHQGHSHSAFCTHHDHHHHHHDHHHHDHHCEDGHDHVHHEKDKTVDGFKLPEELAEEEDMKLYGFGFPHDHHHHHDHDHGHGHHHHVGASELSGLGILSVCDYAFLTILFLGLLLFLFGVFCVAK